MFMEISGLMLNSLIVSMLASASSTGGRIQTFPKDFPSDVP